MSLVPHGLHHLTAVTADAPANLEFYTRVLGMRLVKQTVNQDDVSAYHLFFADGVGSPGSDLTFFEWKLPREVRGNNSISRTSLRVSEASLSWWAGHLNGQGVQHAGPATRGGRPALDFEDPEGQRLSLVADDAHSDPPQPWDRSRVPAEHQIRGLGPVELTVPSLSPTNRVLERAYGLVQTGEYPDPEQAEHTVHVFSMGLGGAHAELHLRVRPDLAPARSGAGGVHHVALRVQDEQYHQWTEQLGALGLRSSGEVDRFWFRSLYYREPQGILIELATDGPGFATDEPLETLGQKLVLPPFLEGRRAQIEAGLTPLESQ
jgi:glyoxalase family protein